VITHGSGAPWSGALLLALLAGSPWIAAIVWVWRRRPRDGAIPPSIGERARQRLRMP
jgi:hypothetical protein